MPSNTDNHSDKSRNIHQYILSIHYHNLPCTYSDIRLGKRFHS